MINTFITKVQLICVCSIFRLSTNLEQMFPNCSLALVTQQQITSFLCSIILSSVACLALQYFSTLTHKTKIEIEHEMCVLIFSATFVWNTSHSKKNSPRYQLPIYLPTHLPASLPVCLSIYMSSCKFAVILVRFKWNLNFSMWTYRWIDRHNTAYSHFS